MEQPDLLRVLDALGRRYGRLPHEVLDLDPWQLGLALQCHQQADADSAHMLNRINNTKGGMVFPVVVLKS